MSFLLYHGGNDDNHLDKLEQVVASGLIDEAHGRADREDRPGDGAAVPAAAGGAGEHLMADGALLAPGALCALCLGYYLVAGLAINVAYHRGLSHRSLVLEQDAGARAGDAGAARGQSHPVGGHPPPAPRPRRPARRSRTPRAGASGTPTTAGTSAAGTRCPACCTPWAAPCASCSTGSGGRAPTTSSTTWRRTSPPIPTTGWSAGPGRTWRSPSAHVAVFFGAAWLLAGLRGRGRAVGGAGGHLQPGRRHRQRQPPGRAAAVPHARPGPQRPVHGLVHPGRRLARQPPPLPLERPARGAARPARLDGLHHPACWNGWGWRATFAGCRPTRSPGPCRSRPMAAPIPRQRHRGSARLHRPPGARSPTTCAIPTPGWRCTSIPACRSIPRPRRR